MPNSSRVYFLPRQLREGLDLKTSTPTDSGGGSEQWVVMSGDLTGVQICNQVTDIDTKKKSSTTQGGGRRIFTIHELRLVVKVVIFNLEKELEMHTESCRQRGWQCRAFQLRGQLLQRGGVDVAVEHCGDLQGSRCRVNTVGCQVVAPLTVFSWVLRGPSLLWKEPPASSTSSARWWTLQPTTASLGSCYTQLKSCSFCLSCHM